MGAPRTAAALGAVAVMTALAAPAIAAGPTVDEIVAKHLAARGGREALAAVKTLRMSGRATAGPGREAIVRREIARPGKIRTEFVFQGTTGIYAFDGTSGWRVSPLDGSFDAEPLPDDEAAASAEQADIEGPLVDFKAKGHQVELVGTSTLPGGPAHELKVTLKSGAARRVFVDAATGFIVRVESIRRVRGHDVTLETDFGDYRKTDGVAFPYSIEGNARGRPNRLRIVVDSVEVNPKLDESRFKMPR
jgi:outer membrane lipoprotein-sorting protein